MLEFVSEIISESKVMTSALWIRQQEATHSIDMNTPHSYVYMEACMSRHPTTLQAPSQAE